MPLQRRKFVFSSTCATYGIPEKMQAYCRFLAQRYAKRNVFWILGGDSTAEGAAGLFVGLFISALQIAVRCRSPPESF